MVADLRKCCNLFYGPTAPGLALALQALKHQAYMFAPRLLVCSCKGDGFLCMHKASLTPFVGFRPAFRTQTQTGFQGSLHSSPPNEGRNIKGVKPLVLCGMSAKDDHQSNAQAPLDVGAGGGTHMYTPTTHRDIYTSGNLAEQETSLKTWSLRFQHHV